MKFRILFSSACAIAISAAILFQCQKVDELPLKKAQTETSVAEEASTPWYVFEKDSKKALPRPMIWGDREMYRSVVTPATFKPENVPYGELYLAEGDIKFRDGITLIAESVPGDQDYRGGKWHLNVIRSTSTRSFKVKYEKASGVEDLNLKDFLSTQIYLNISLLPMKGE